MMNNDCPMCQGTVVGSRDTSSGYEVIRLICLKCGWEQKTRRDLATWRVMQEQRRNSLFWRIVRKLWR